MNKILTLASLAFLHWSLIMPAFSQETVRYEQAQVTAIDNVKVAANDAGVISELKIQHGECVDADQMLVQLDKSLFRSQFDTAQIEYEIARLQSTNDINFRFAKKSKQVNDKVLERSRNARKKYRDSISVTELEQLELSLEQSILSTEQAEFENSVNTLNVDLRESQLATAEIRLRNRNILSPINGLAADIYVQKGEWVNAGQPIARIVNLDRLRVKAIYKIDALEQIDKNTKALFEFQLGQVTKNVAAKIYFISPEIDPANQDFEVWADIENASGEIRPGIKGTLILDVK